MHVLTSMLAMLLDGVGTVTIRPAVAYEGEERDFSIFFDATGPMYGSTIVVTIPDSLHPDPTATDADDSVGSLLTAALRVTGDHDSWVVNNDGVVTITAGAMNKNDDVRISYRDVTVGEPGTDDVPFEEFEVRDRDW